LGVDLPSVFSMFPACRADRLSGVTWFDRNWQLPV
jgi:hypothetical protein